MIYTSQIQDLNTSVTNDHGYVACLLASLIMSQFPNYIRNGILIFTLGLEFELSLLPSIPPNGHIGGLC